MNIYVYVIESISLSFFFFFNYSSTTFFIENIYACKRSLKWINNNKVRLQHRQLHFWLFARGA